MNEHEGRALVVDDNPVNRMTLARSIERQGLTVEIAAGGAEALAAMRRQEFDVVLLDILMPEVDGYAVLSRMKGDPGLRSIPVIVISALDELDSVVRCLEMGAEDYLPKPFNPLILSARLESCLRRKKLRDLEQAYLRQELMLRQSEKLATLGRLSAGLAHELNNPAAAAARGAALALDAFTKHREARSALDGCGMSQVQIAHLTAALQVSDTASQRPQPLDPLEVADREARLGDWLADLGASQVWECASVLAEAGYDVPTVQPILAAFPREQVPDVLRWLASGLSLIQVLEDVRRASRRVSEVVLALKDYAFLDRGPVQEVDVRQGLESALLMLRPRIHDGITVTRQYADDVPLLLANGSELGQVWTHLLDNAIAALGEGGELRLGVRRQDDKVVVEVGDSGPGIPEEIRGRIFDPFFTTRQPGEGVGLGLTICHTIVVQKYGGEIEAFSAPGDTRFVVRLPLGPAAP